MPLTYYVIGEMFLHILCCDFANDILCHWQNICIYTIGFVPTFFRSYSSWSFPFSPGRAHPRIFLHVSNIPRVNKRNALTLGTRMGRSGIVFNLSLFNVVPPVLLTVLSRSNTVQVLFLSPVPVNISKFINLK